jgi:hypothetical protein
MLPLRLRHFGFLTISHGFYLKRVFFYGYFILTDFAYMFQDVFKNC